MGEKIQDTDKQMIIIRLVEGEDPPTPVPPTRAAAPRPRLPKPAPRACAEDCFEVDSACAHLPLHLRQACRLEQMP